MNEQTPFFVLALGRSGTAFLAALLNDDPLCQVHHEPCPDDNTIIRLRYAGNFTTVVDHMLEERFSHMMKTCLGRISRYGEVNSYLRYEAPWLRHHLDADLLHLVRDGRDVVRSLYIRDVYRNSEVGNPFVPRDGDPCAGTWHRWSRFQRLCWYWQHTNGMLKDSTSALARLEDITSSYHRFQSDVLSPLSLQVTEARWEQEISRPKNTSRQNLKQFGRRWKQREALPHWRAWSDEHTQQFWDICGDTMERCGYSRDAQQNGSDDAAERPVAL